MLRPLGSNILVQVVEEEKQEGLIVLPDSAEKEKTRGVVIAVGGEVEEVKVGQTVIFGKYAGDDLSGPNDRFKVVREEECLAVVEE